jgi:uncharacterized protein
VVVDKMSYSQIAPEWALLKSWLQANFDCNGCGNCCIGKESIHINANDIKKIARHFKIPINKARMKYAKPHPTITDELTLKKTNPCKFHDATNRICKIYEDRPTICRLFPFLSDDNLKMNEIAIYPNCPGQKATLDSFIEKWAGHRENPEDNQLANQLEEDAELKERVMTYCLWRLGYYDWSEDDEEVIQLFEQEMGPVLEEMKKTLETKVLSNAAIIFQEHKGE